MVTLLIGFNIVQIIDIKGIEEKIKKNILRFESQNHNAITEYLYSQIDNDDNNCIEYITLKNIIASLKYDAEAEDFLSCNRTIRIFINKFHLFDRNYSENEIDVIMRFLYSIPNTKEIDMWKEFEKKIKQICQPNSSN